VIDQTPPGGSWGTVIAILSGTATTIGAFLAGRNKRKADDAATDTEAVVITTLRAEFKRLSDRVEKLERREIQLQLRVWQLEGVIRKAGIEPPPEPESTEGVA
jgi:hypothetical protein